MPLRLGRQRRTNPRGYVQSTLIRSLLGWLEGLLSDRVGATFLRSDRGTYEKNQLKNRSSTLVVEEAATPVPPLVDVTADVVLTQVPMFMPCTTTEKVQLSVTPRVAPVKLMLVEPGTAVITPPPQLPSKPLSNTCTARPGGRVSVNETPVSAREFTGGLLTVKLIAVDPENS